MAKRGSGIWVLMVKIQAAGVFFCICVTSEAQSSEEFSFVLPGVTSRMNNVGLCVATF